MSVTENLVFQRADWMQHAGCRGTSPETFFPQRGIRGYNLNAEVARIRELCAACPVREECLGYAVDNRILHGFWGGQSPRERRLARGQQRRQRLAS